MSSVGLGLADPINRQPSSLALAGLLLGLGIVHTEIELDIERTRRRLNAARSLDIGHFDLTSVWTAAAALLLPAPLAGAVTVVVCGHLWARAFRQAGNPLFRAIYSWCTSGAASIAAASTMHAADLQLTSGARTVAQLGIVLLALAAYAVVNTGLIAGAITLAVPGTRFWSNVGGGADNLLELATLGLGGIFAVIVVGPSPWTAVLLLPMLLILHRAFGVQELERAADTDSGTGLLSSAAWHRRAHKELRRAARRRQRAAVVLVDVDGFRRFNTTKGHQRGDDFLARAGAALTDLVRADDVLGRYGGDEFAVLLSPVDQHDLPSIARRLVDGVAEVAQQANEDLTASAGCASFPDDGLTLEDLISAANASLGTARSAGPASVELGALASLSLEEFREARKRRFA